MDNQAYPSNALPNPTLSFGHEVTLSTLFTQGDDGYLTIYPQISLPIYEARASWDLSKNEFYLWRSFFIGQLNNAVNWCRISLPFGEQGFSACRIRIKGGSFTANHQGPNKFTITTKLDLQIALVNTTDNTLLTADNTLLTADNYS